MYSKHCMRCEPLLAVFICCFYSPSGVPQGLFICVLNNQISVSDKIGVVEMLSGHVLNPSPFKISWGSREHLLLDFLSTLALLPATLNGRTSPISFMPACFSKVRLMFFLIAWPNRLTFASLRASR